MNFTVDLSLLAGDRDAWLSAVCVRLNLSFRDRNNRMTEWPLLARNGHSVTAARDGTISRLAREVLYLCTLPPIGVVRADPMSAMRGNPENICSH
jgi:hypothetical protein